MAPCQWCQSADRLYSTPESKRTSFPFPTTEVTHAEHARPLPMWCLSYRGRRETPSWVPFRAGKWCLPSFSRRCTLNTIPYASCRASRMARTRPDPKKCSDPQHMRGGTHARTVSLKVPTGCGWSAVSAYTATTLNQTYTNTHLFSTNSGVSSLIT